MSASRPSRSSLPLLLAVLSLLAFSLGAPALAAPLVLFCPGWGLTRCVSVLDRGCGVAGSALCASWLLLGGASLAGAALAAPTDRVGLWIHLASLILCLAGRARLALHDRWQARQPPHPAPMPLWPERRLLAFVTLVGALLLVLLTAPLGQSTPSDGALLDAARAQAWAHGATQPLAAGTPLGSAEWPAAAVAGLMAASGVSPLAAARLIPLAALAACLLLLAEGISRLLGNRGGTRAMLAFLLGLNPLAFWFLWNSTASGAGALPDLGWSGAENGTATALSAFTGGVRLPMTLAITAWMLFASLSILRRASLHVPRLLALAGLSLVLVDSRAAWLLLPGWMLGLLMSHLACLTSPDNQVGGSGTPRRPREPAALRAPFWRPALHLLLGAGLGLMLTGPPHFSVRFDGQVLWYLALAVGPGCVLFLPGVRHLNASPGREAFFFVGLCLTLVLLGSTSFLPGDGGELVCRLGALVLAIPMAHGALRFAQPRSAPRRVALSLAAGLALIGPGAWWAQRRLEPRPVRVRDGQWTDRRRHDGLLAALGKLDRVGAPRAPLLLGRFDPPIERPLAALASGRSLLAGQGAMGQAADALLAGDAMALATLNDLLDSQGEELLSLTRGPTPPGFLTLRRAGAFTLGHSRPPDIVLISIDDLRADRVSTDRMTRLVRRTRRGSIYQTAITPSPSTAPALASLLTGLSPAQHGLREADGQLDPAAPSLARRLARRGYRTSAVVSLSDDRGLLAPFEQVFSVPEGRADTLVPKAMARLAEPDPRPVFLWLHLSDLRPPYVLPAALQNEHTGTFPFPADGDLAATTYGVAAFPPAPEGTLGGVEIDVARGVACYDALIGQLDRELAPLLDSIPDEDLLVLTAPHGTALFEHEAWFGCGPDLFEPALHVPLLICGAGRPARLSSRLLSLSDVSALLLSGDAPTRDAVLLESGWRPGLGTGAAMDPALDPGARGAARRIWGERRLHSKTLLTIPGDADDPAAGVRYLLDQDPDEMEPLPANAYELRRIDAWRRRGHPARADR